MPTPLESIDKNIQRLVRELVDKDQETLNDIDDKAEDIVEEIKENKDEAKKGRKGFMKVFGNVTGIFKKIGGFMGDLKGYFQKIVSNITTHIKEILGPVAEAYDFIKDTFANLLNSMKGIWTKLFVSTGIQQKIMAGIFSIFKRGEKKEAREDGKIKRTVVGLFGLLAVTLGLAIGALLGIVGKPLLFMTKMFGAPFKVIGKILKHIPIVGRFFSRIGLFIRSISGPFRRLINVMKQMPILGKLIQGLRLGFKWFGWPLIILLSLIDGIKAWANTEGTKVDKTKAALKAIFDSIFELPILILGWIPTKVLSLLGIDFDVGKKMMDMYHWIIDKIIGEVIEMFADPKKYFAETKVWITDTFNSIISWIKEFPKNLQTSVDNMISKLDTFRIDIENYILNIPKKIVEFFISIDTWMKETFTWENLKKLFTGGFKIGEKIGDMKNKIGDAVISKGSAVASSVKDVLQGKGFKESEGNEKLQKSFSSLEKNFIKALEKNANKGQNNTAVVPAGGGGGGRNDIPANVTDTGLSIVTQLQ